jgi:hypothetical protein
MTARQRLTDALAASAQPIPHTLWLPSKAWALDGLQARKPVPCAARRRGARHNGGLVNPLGRVTQCSGGSTKRSVSVVTDDILPNSPLCSVGFKPTYPYAAAKAQWALGPLRLVNTWFCAISA